MNRNQIKYLAVAAMLIDHIAWQFVPLGSTLGQMMHFIGRLTGPTMAFFLVEGYLHTRSLSRYAMRLGIFALLSWVPYSLFEKGSWPTLQFGVVYTLFLSLLALWVWDRSGWPKGARVAAVLALCLLSVFGDWPVYDILFALLFLRWHEDDRRKWIAYAAVAACIMIDAIAAKGNRGLFQTGVLVLPPLILRLYNGQPGRRNLFHKWFFFIFYPAHLLFLWWFASRGIIASHIWMLTR